MLGRVNHFARFNDHCFTWEGNQNSPMDRYGKDMERSSVTGDLFLTDGNVELFFS